MRPYSDEREVHVGRRWGSGGRPLTHWPVVASSTMKSAKSGRVVPTNRSGLRGESPEAGVFEFGELQDAMMGALA